MSFRRSWSPTLGQRKSHLTLQRNLEEKRLFLRSTSSASHSCCAASPASTLAPALRPAKPSHPGLRCLGRRPAPSTPMAAIPVTRFRSGALCRQLLLTLTVSGYPGHRIWGGGSDGLGRKGDTLEAGVGGGGGQSGLASGWLKTGVVWGGGGQTEWGWRPERDP